MSRPLSIRSVRSVACAVAGLLAGHAGAQCLTWTQAPLPGPSPRQNHGAVYSAAAGAFVLFGGYRGGFGFNGETWLLSSATGELEWAPGAGAGPSPRANFAMEYDSRRGRVVLFGGFPGGSIMYDDTWVWSGGAWTQLSPAASPSGRYNHAMAYDAARDRIVLFGGWNGARQSDTWLFDGSSWSQVFPATVPGARSSHAMVYDSVRQRVVMFGGFRGGSWSGETWEWDGTNWSLSPATGPAPRQYMGMTFDSGRGVTVLAAGQGANFVRLNDTWEYNGAAWTQLTQSGEPTVRDQHVLAYGQGMVVLHGGYQGAGGVLSDTWMLECPAPACSTDYNQDGGGDNADVIDLAGDVAAGTQSFPPSSPDFNGDGGADNADVIDLAGTIAGGPCP